MAGTDQIVINTRERAASSDVNDLQSLKDRTLLESWLHAFARRVYTIGAAPTETPDAIVMGGLEAGPSGNDIAIQPGVLLQDSAVLAPAPGALDSTYRWSEIRSSSIIANPAPGSDTWYLIEAQMSETIASSVLRDIFDTGTGTFVPTLVTKRTERTITFQLVAGTTTDLPVPSGGDFVVIAGVLVPTGGGAIPVANFLDMRRLPTDLGAAPKPAAVQGRRNLLAAEGTFVDWTMAAEASFEGQRLWFDASQTGIDLTNATVLAALRPPAENPQAGNQITYLYLTHYFGYPVRNTYGRIAAGNLDESNGNGLLIWSTTVPGTDRETNSVALALPAPFNNATAAIGDAVAVALIVNDANGMHMSGNNDQGVIDRGQAVVPITFSFVPTGGADVITAPTIPAAKSIRYECKWEDEAAGDATAIISVAGGVSIFEVRYDSGGQIYFWRPPGNFTVQFNGATIPTTSVRVTAIEYSL